MIYRQSKIHRGRWQQWLTWMNKGHRLTQQRPDVGWLNNCKGNQQTLLHPSQVIPHPIWSPSTELLFVSLLERELEPCILTVVCVIEPNVLVGKVTDGIVEVDEHFLGLSCENKWTNEEHTSHQVINRITNAKTLTCILWRKRDVLINGKWWMFWHCSVWWFVVSGVLDSE